MEEAVAALGNLVSIEMFDHVSDRAGWSKSLPGVESLHRLAPAPERRRDDEALDERFEKYAASLEAEEISAGRDLISDVKDPIEGVLDAVQLMSAVLTNSELVSDLDLRRQLFKDALRSSLSVQPSRVKCDSGFDG
jgi:hypothetical protein